MATATKTKKKTSLKPLDDRVLVQPTEAEEKTASGIYLPRAQLILLNFKRKVTCS